MSQDSVIALLQRLREFEVDFCLSGGWGVDALLGEQTREHADLDLWLPAAQLGSLFQAFHAEGVDRVHPWPGDRPWNFVLQDGGDRRVDLHMYEQRPDGSLHYGSALGGDVFPAEALAGLGTIGDMPVRCESAEWSLRWHTGYPPREADYHDVRHLCRKFGLPLPPAFA